MENNKQKLNSINYKIEKLQDERNLTKKVLKKEILDIYLKELLELKDCGTDNQYKTLLKCFMDDITDVEKSY